MRLYVLAQDAQRDITINVLADTEAGATQAAGALLHQMRSLHRL